MRLAPVLFACLIIADCVSAADPTNVVMQAPTDEAIIGLCGGRLAMVFDRFGTPRDLRASGDNDGGVDLDYGAFGFKIKNKTATVCFFWQAWKGPVKGIKIGDSKEQVLKILGVNTNAFKYPDGLVDYGWKLKEEKVILWAYFDKDDKVKKITAELN